MTPLDHWRKLITQLHLANRMVRTREWTPELDAQLGEYMNAGHSFKKIDEIMVMPDGSSRVRAKALGLKRECDRPLSSLTDREIGLLLGTKEIITVATALRVSATRARELRRAVRWKAKNGMS